MTTLERQRKRLPINSIVVIPEYDENGRVTRGSKLKIGIVDDVQEGLSSDIVAYMSRVDTGNVDYNEMATTYCAFAIDVHPYVGPPLANVPQTQVDAAERDRRLRQANPANLTQDEALTKSANAPRATAPPRPPRRTYTTGFDPLAILLAVGLAALTAPACAPSPWEPIPYGDAAQTGPLRAGGNDPDMPAPQATAEALCYLEARWLRVDGREVSNARALQIEWYRPPSDKYHGGARVTGRTNTPTQIALEYDRDRVNPIGDSAISHEFVHVALIELEGDGDANHELPPGVWTPAHTAWAEAAQDFLRGAGL